MEQKGNRDLNALRAKAYYLRLDYVEDMDKHLLNFESRATSHNLNVVWALDENQLVQSIIDLLPSKKYNKICVDLEHIPSSLDSAPQVNIVSLQNIENHYDEAETIVINADFGVVENGALVFFDKKSSNLFNCFKNFIIVVNLDDFVVRQSDIRVLMDLKNDQATATDTKIIQFPFKKIEKDPMSATGSLGYTEEEVKINVILYENGITDYMLDPFLRQSLYCIHCGKCSAVCPVSQINKDITPIDIVKNNCLDIFNRTQSIFRQTTLCGNCQEVCPINIPLTDMLIYEMQLVNENKDASNNKLLYNILSKRTKMNNYNKPFMRFFLTKFLFGKNKMQYNYFSNNKSTFFNITRISPDNPDE